MYNGKIWLRGCFLLFSVPWEDIPSQESHTGKAMVLQLNEVIKSFLVFQNYAVW